MLNIGILFILGVLGLVGIFLQIKRFKKLELETNFFNTSSYPFHEAAIFHTIIAPCYSVALLPYFNRRFRLRQDARFSGPIPMSNSLFWSRYGIHFLALQVLIIAAIAVTLYNGSSGSLPHSAGTAILVCYLFYWKWIFGPLVLFGSIMLELLHILYSDVPNARDLSVLLFELITQSGPAEQLGTAYVLLVGVSILLGAITDSFGEIFFDT